MPLMKKVSTLEPAFISPIISAAESSDILQACGELGPDPSSLHFANRTKNIAFVLCLNGRWFQLNHGFFNQHAGYNDFSGGYRRHYRQLPAAFVDSLPAQRLLHAFKDTYAIPDGKLVLVQVQATNLTPHNQGKCLTGQGIHSDGADCAMLACLRRENVSGARSAVFRDADGDDSVVSPHVLEEGEVLFWRDNEVYHYVEPARLVDDECDGTRAVLIAHYPAMHYITGGQNMKNTLPPSGKHPRYVTEGEGSRLPQ